MRSHPMHPTHPMHPVQSQSASLTLDEGGVADLCWTNAWRGLLTLQMRDFRSSHPFHVHDYYSICLVDSGEAEIICRGEAYRAGPGSVMLISPFEVHQEVNTSNTPWFFRAMHPAMATMRRVLGMERTAGLDRLRFTSPVVNDAALADQLHRMFEATTRSSDGSITDEVADPVRASLLRHFRPVDERRRRLRGQRAVETVRARILDAHREMPSLTELASLTGLSRFHLSRTFRDATGLPPYAYFEQVRLARAKVMIRQGYELSAVAMALGYSDQSHFHRQFRERAAMTPGRYAQALRKVFGVGARTAVRNPAA